MSRQADFTTLARPRKLSDKERAAQVAANRLRGRERRERLDAEMRERDARLGAASRARAVEHDRLKEAVRAARADLRQARTRLVQGDVAEAREAAAEIPVLEAMVERSEGVLKDYLGQQPQHRGLPMR